MYSCQPNWYNPSRTTKLSWTLRRPLVWSLYFRFRKIRNRCRIKAFKRRNRLATGLLAVWWLFQPRIIGFPSGKTGCSPSSARQLLFQESDTANSYNKCCQAKELKNSQNLSMNPDQFREERCSISLGISNWTSWGLRHRRQWRKPPATATPRTYNCRTKVLLYQLLLLIAVKIQARSILKIWD